MAENTNSKEYDKSQEDLAGDISPEDVANPSRRWLLKVLIAGGVATAANFVPKKWSTPVIEGGVLPAHAQCSPVVGPCPLISCFGGGTIDLQPGQQSVNLDFSATVSPIPPVGTSVVAHLDTINPRSVEAFTNSNGQAFFNDVLVLLSNVSGNSITATVQESLDSCSITWTINSAPYP